MQDAIWGMKHFDVYLKGRPFTLFSDRKPLKMLGKVHTQTYYQLQLDYMHQVEHIWAVVVAQW